jgi:soluble lytic murein transglycosylase-like protein
MGVEKIHAIIAAASARNGVEPCLVHAVALYESGLNPNTISTTGAIGLMALQPTTAAKLSAEDPFDPHANVDVGTRLLKQLSQYFNGDVDLILAGYNAGPDAINRYGGVPPFPETKDYAAYVGGIYRLCKSNPQAFLAR